MEANLWVNTRFTGEQVPEFRKVQRFLGIGNNTDVVRYLVRQQARFIESCENGEVEEALEREVADVSALPLQVRAE